MFGSLHPAAPETADHWTFQGWEPKFIAFVVFLIQTELGFLLFFKTNFQNIIYYFV